MDDSQKIVLNDGIKNNAERRTIDYGDQGIHIDNGNMLRNNREPFGFQCAFHYIVAIVLLGKKIF